MLARERGRIDSDKRTSPPSAQAQRRFAVLTVSPMTVYSRRRSEPMLTGERLAVIEPDADLETRAAPRAPARVESSSAAHHVERGLDRAVGVVAALIGAPHCAITASPMNLSSVPPCRNTQSTISVKNSVSSVAVSSGVMRAASAREVADVANSTAIVRSLAA